MKKNRWSFVPGIIVAGLFTIGCRPAAARPPQASLQDPAPPPPPQADATAPRPSPDGAPPPPPGRGRRAGPPPSGACGPDAPPPPAAAAYPTTPAVMVRNTVRQLNYGPEGEVSGFLLSNGTQVNLPPEVGEQFASLAKPKSEVSISGYPRQTASGKTILDATAITAGGQSIVIAGPRTAPPRTAPLQPLPAQPEPPRN